MGSAAQDQCKRPLLSNRPTKIVLSDGWQSRMIRVSETRWQFPCLKKEFLNVLSEFFVSKSDSRCLIFIQFVEIICFY